MKVFFIDNGLRNNEKRKEEILKDLEFVRRAVLAIKTHIEIIKQSDDPEVIAVSLEAMEEIFPGTKKRSFSRNKWKMFRIGIGLKTFKGVVSRLF